MIMNTIITIIMSSRTAPPVATLAIKRISILLDPSGVEEGVLLLVVELLVDPGVLVVVIIGELVVEVTVLEAMKGKDK